MLDKTFIQSLFELWKELLWSIFQCLRHIRNSSWGVDAWRRCRSIKTWEGVLIFINADKKQISIVHCSSTSIQQIIWRRVCTHGGMIDQQWSYGPNVKSSETSWKHRSWWFLWVRSVCNSHMLQIVAQFKEVLQLPHVHPNNLIEDNYCEEEKIKC